MYEMMTTELDDATDQWPLARSRRRRRSLVYLYLQSSRVMQRFDVSKRFICF